MIPQAPRRRRRARARRRSYRRNPALFGLKVPGLPNMMDIGVTVAGGIGSKWLGKTLFPQGATLIPGGWGGPLTTLGVGIAASMVLGMLKMRAFAKPLVAGAATIALLDAIKLTPLGAQLGSYVAPAGDTPVLSGVGAYPEGFADPSLSAGEDMNYPGGFEAEPYGDGVYS
jgi:hypothetical protein